MTKKFLIRSSAFLIVFMMLVMPTLSLAVNTPLVQDCPTTGCGWNELMALVNRVIKFILFDMVVPIAAIMFVYAGVLMITAGGDTGAVTKARSVFTNAVIGFIVAVAAWLIIRTILSILGYQGAWIGF